MIKGPDVLRLITSLINRGLPTGSTCYHQFRPYLGPLDQIEGFDFNQLFRAILLTGRMDDLINLAQIFGLRVDQFNDQEDWLYEFLEESQLLLNPDKIETQSLPSPIEDRLDELDKLDKPDELDKLDKLDKPDELDKLDKLDKPDELDKLGNMDQNLSQFFERLNDYWDLTRFDLQHDQLDNSLILSLGSAPETLLTLKKLYDLKITTWNPETYDLEIIELMIQINQVQSLKILWNEYELHRITDADCLESLLATVLRTRHYQFLDFFYEHQDLGPGDLELNSTRLESLITKEDGQELAIPLELLLRIYNFRETEPESQIELVTFLGQHGLIEELKRLAQFKDIKPVISSIIGKFIEPKSIQWRPVITYYHDNGKSKWGPLMKRVFGKYANVTL